MIIRISALFLFATLVAAAPFGTAAQAATQHHRTMHHPHAAHHPAHGRSGATRAPAGSAATDALNEQSLNNARGGTAPTPMSAPTTTPAE